MRISARLLTTITGLGLLPLTGCASMDGTWLFQWDLASLGSATNCDDDDEVDVEYQGDRYEWIDIYTTSGGALVLTNGDQEYVGIADGDSFEVKATYGENVDGDIMEWEKTIEGTLEGKDLAGSSVLNEIDGSCNTQTKQKYAGVKMQGTDATTRNHRHAIKSVFFDQLTSLPADLHPR